MHLLTRILPPEVPDWEVIWMLEPDLTQDQQEPAQPSPSLSTQNWLTAQQERFIQGNKIHRRAGIQLFAPM